MLKFTVIPKKAIWHCQFGKIGVLDNFILQKLKSKHLVCLSFIWWVVVENIFLTFRAIGPGKFVKKNKYNMKISVDHGRNKNVINIGFKFIPDYRVLYFLEDIFSWEKWHKSPERIWNSRDWYKPPRWKRGSWDRNINPRFTRSKNLLKNGSSNPAILLNL